jgi:two-component system cell cycle response regulator DivK
MDQDTSILIVEDLQDIREMYSRFLSKQGFAVVEAADGHEALEKISQHRPDLILMDLSLPGMDGWTVTRMLKANHETRHTPVIVLTAFSVEGAAIVVETGCEGFLMKPCSPANLIAEIDRVLNRADAPNLAQRNI